MNCAIDWIGMASRDVPTGADLPIDTSFFPTLPDRAQQGVINRNYLDAVAESLRMVSRHDPAFQTADGRPVFDTTKSLYDGNSRAASWAAWSVRYPPRSRAACSACPA